ncbi:hypothetical protein R3W88_028262 [Solanum pinnatisectum]|uniref:NAC domain-containing protein n=1 Tax=Solanum pinnatisectum TaxID=50273 RepID=A0AAV9LJ20_9SOLN|nr:hypothetical protein R3W88_028262 [Solanum pinnatisectum]
MKEYSLDDKVIKLLTNRGIMKHEDVVLCYIRCKVKESGNHMPRATASENDDDTQPQGPICTGESGNHMPTTARGNDDDTQPKGHFCTDESGNHMPTTTARGNDDDDDDDIQPQGPNESGYGDQLPQQMVKPMQNIESGYVGCDDEKMNHMTTQPQWPNESGYGDQLQQMVNPMQNIESGYVGCDDELMNDMTTQPQWPISTDDYQLPQQIVTFPMVQGGSAMMNEGNINTELVVPYQLLLGDYNSIQSLLLGDYNDPSTLTNEMMNITATQYTSVGEFLNSGQSFSSLLG